MNQIKKPKQKSKAVNYTRNYILSTIPITSEEIVTKFSNDLFLLESKHFLEQIKDMLDKFCDIVQSEVEEELVQVESIVAMKFLTKCFTTNQRGSNRKAKGLLKVFEYLNEAFLEIRQKVQVSQLICDQYKKVSENNDFTFQKGEEYRKLMKYLFFEDEKFEKIMKQLYLYANKLKIGKNNELNQFMETYEDVCYQYDLQSLKRQYQSQQIQRMKKQHAEIQSQREKGIIRENYGQQFFEAQQLDQRLLQIQAQTSQAKGKKNKKKKKGNPNKSNQDQSKGKESKLYESLEKLIHQIGELQQMTLQLSKKFLTSFNNDS